MIEEFGHFGTGQRRRYLQTRAQIRRAIDVDGLIVMACEPGQVERPVSLTITAIVAAAARLGPRTYSSQMIPGEDLGVDPLRIAAAFGGRVGELASKLRNLLDGPLGRLAAQTEVRPEVGLAAIALSALEFVTCAPDGLDSRCDDLRHELDRLEDLLSNSGEVGEVDDWEPRGRRGHDFDRKRGRAGRRRTSEVAG